MEKKRHIHADLMIAYAEDKNLKYEFFCDDLCKWVLCTEQPLFYEDFQYRLHEREFPKTSLSVDDLVKISLCKPFGEHELVTVANEAIKQYILDTEKESK